MRITDALMARLGYVKLERYGLAMTPQGRIVTTQGSILDDGSGGRVVGWERGDLAALSLSELPIGKAKEAPAAIPQPPMAFAPTMPMAPVTPVAKPVAPPPTPAPAPQPPVQVAKLALEGITQFSTPAFPPKASDGDDEQDDEDWDWQMAVARARAVADEAEAAVKAKPPAPIVPATKITAPPAPPVAALVAPTGVKVTPPPTPSRSSKMAAPVIRDSSMVNPALKAPTKSNVVALPPRRAARGTGPQAPEEAQTNKVALVPAPPPAPPSVQVQRPMPLPPPTEDTTRAKAAPPRRRGPAPAATFARIEPMPVEDTRPETRTEIKPAPLPRITSRFAAGS